MSSIKQLINDFLIRPPEGEYKPNPKRGKWFNILRKIFWRNIRPKYRKLRKGAIERSNQTITFTQKYKTFSLAIPILVYGFYTTLIQTSLYESTTSVMVENKAPNADVASPLASLTGATNNLKDLHLLVDYINSQTMLKKLDSSLNIRQKYKDIQGIDVFSALIFGDNRSFLDYYQKRLNLEINEDSATLIVKYQSPDPKETLETIQAIIFYSEEFLNETNREVLAKEIKFYETELQNVMADIRKLKNFLASKQIEASEISPSRSFEAASASIMEIEANLLKQKAELAQLESYLNPEALQIKTAKSQISKLNDQIKELKKSVIVDEQNPDGTFSSLSFTTAEMELLLLTEKYKMVLQSLQQHKFNAIHNAKYLVNVITPYEEDEPQYPNRIINIIIFSLLYLIGLFIIKVTLELIHEHKFY
jgi:capsular polysaccharide transport system permease protein